MLPRPRPALAGLARVASTEVPSSAIHGNKAETNTPLHDPAVVFTLSGLALAKMVEEEEGVPPLQLPCREVFARGGRAIGSTVRLIWLPQPRSTTGSGPRILGRTARRHARRSDGLHQRLPRTIEGLSEHCSYGLVTAPYGHASRLHSLLLYSGVSASGRVGALTGALRQMLLFVSHPAIPPTREWTDSRAMRTPSGCVPSGSRRHSP
jgi:hypothetical protein